MKHNMSASLAPPTDRTYANPSPFTPELTQALERVEATVWSRLYRLATADEKAALGLHTATVGSSTVMAAARSDVLFFNRVVGLGMEALATEADLDAIVACYRNLGVERFFVQLSPAALPGTLFDWLPARGFRPYNNWVKLFRDVEPPPPATTELRIEEVGPTFADELARLCVPAFEWPAAAESMLARLLRQPGWRLYAAFDGAAPVAGAAFYAEGPYAYVGPAATHPAHRGRGAQSALIERRIRDAAAAGCTMLISETAEDRPERSSPSYRNLRRCGFQFAYRRPNYLLDAAT